MRLLLSRQANVDLDDLRLHDYHSYEVPIKSANGLSRGQVRFSCQWIPHAGVGVGKGGDGSQGGGARDVSLAASTLGTPYKPVAAALPNIAMVSSASAFTPREYGDELAPMGRQRAITAQMHLVEPQHREEEAAFYAADGSRMEGGADEGGGRMRSVTMARRERRDTVGAIASKAKKSRESSRQSMGGGIGNGSRGRGISGAAGGFADATLARNFLLAHERDGWKRFVCEALMPGVEQANNPFPHLRDLSSMESDRSIISTLDAAADAADAKAEAMEKPGDGTGRARGVSFRTSQVHGTSRTYRIGRDTHAKELLDKVKFDHLSAVSGRARPASPPPLTHPAPPRPTHPAPPRPRALRRCPCAQHPAPMPMPMPAGRRFRRGSVRG